MACQAVPCPHLGSKPANSGLPRSRTCESNHCTTGPAPIITVFNFMLMSRLLTAELNEQMKRHPVVESVLKPSFPEEENSLWKEAEKTWHPKASRWEAGGSLRALPSHASGNKLSLSESHVSQLCLCGCSLRTKAVMHPRPPPVSRSVSRVLPSLSSGRKQLSPAIDFKSQLSQSFPKPKVQSQLLSWCRSRASCNAMPLCKSAPMGMWPQGFLDPLTKTLPEESLHTSVPLGESHFLRQRAIFPMIPLVEGGNPQSSLTSLFK
uniref:Uncharacterized protein n=2 Tax=Equus asinus TaxID=9793 RepID=A0A9L0K9T7_EQUAS